MSRYGDHTPTQELWERIEGVQQEYKLTWGQILMMMAEIIGHILHYNMDVEEI